MLPAIPDWPAIKQLSPICTLWATWTWLSKKVFFPITVSVTEPLSIVLLAPISTPSSKITFPICGVLIFLFLTGIKPKPLIPILTPSCIWTLFEINEFLIVTKVPIIQLLPILTLLLLYKLSLWVHIKL